MIVDGGRYSIFCMEMSRVYWGRGGSPLLFSTTNDSVPAILSKLGHLSVPGFRVMLRWYAIGFRLKGSSRLLAWGPTIPIARRLWDPTIPRHKRRTVESWDPTARVRDWTWDESRDRIRPGENLLPQVFDRLAHHGRKLHFRAPLLPRREQWCVEVHVSEETPSDGAPLDEEPPLDEGAPLDEGLTFLFLLAGWSLTIFSCLFNFLPCVFGACGSRVV